MRLSALVDGQPAIVAVESYLQAVRGCKDRRHHVEVERRRDVLTARENVVGGLGLNTGLRRRPGGAPALTGGGRPAAIAFGGAALGTALAPRAGRRPAAASRRPG